LRNSDACVNWAGDHRTPATPISGAPTLHQIVADGSAHRDRLDMQVGKRLQVFSFTFG
jgi:hypothetical protein